MKWGWYHDGSVDSFATLGSSDSARVFQDIVQQGRAYGIDSGFFSKLELSQRTAYSSQISSNIIKYHHISSHIITYHHISPVVQCGQIYDQKSSSRLNPKASNLRRTTCREASLGYRGRGSQQVQAALFPRLEIGDPNVFKFE
jgi:hypothetical protein